MSSVASKEVSTRSAMRWRPKSFRSEYIIPDYYMDNLACLWRSGIDNAVMKVLPNIVLGYLLWHKVSPLHIMIAYTLFYWLSQYSFTCSTSASLAIRVMEHYVLLNLLTVLVMRFVTTIPTILYGIIILPVISIFINPILYASMSILS